MKELKDRATHESDKKKKGTELNNISKETKITADDKVISADTVNKLKLDGTKEFLNKIKDMASNVEKSLEKLMQSHKETHDKSSEEGSKTEGELKEASDASGEDSMDAKKAADKISDKSVSAEMKKAADEAKEDQNWLDDIKEKRRAEREKYREIVGKQIRRAASAQFNNFKFGGFFY